MRVTAGEMYVYLGLRITMGAYPRERTRMYWNEDDDIDAGLNLPAVSSTMRVNRFEEITAQLSFMVVGDARFDGDKLRKLREIDTLLQERCSGAWDVEQCFTVDESRVRLGSKFCPFTWRM